MFKGKTGKFIVGNLMAICVFAAAILLAGHYSAQAQGQPVNVPPDKDAFKIGTYDKMQAFQKHPAQAELKKIERQANTDMQKAQKQGDQQKMREAQQQYQQKRQQVLQKFEQDVSEAVPEIAKEAGLEAVALDVVYTKNDVKTKDITPELINSFTEEKGKDKKKGKIEMPPFPEQKQ